jgi:hypothetical protein
MNLDQQNSESMNNMSQFEPIEPPVNIIKTDKLLGSPIQPVRPIGEELNRGPFESGRAAAYMALSSDPSDYESAYNRPQQLNEFYRRVTGEEEKTQQSQQMDRYLEKLNYLIYLLEEKQVEKTAGVTEEFILYCLFGVFIIFIVDGFARYGKNVGQAIARPRYKR